MGYLQLALAHRYAKLEFLYVWVRVQMSLQQLVSICWGDERREMKYQLKTIEKMPLQHEKKWQGKYAYFVLTILRQT